MVKIASITARIIALLDFISAVQYTVPLKGKLTVSTRSSKLDSRVAKVETFEFRDARSESRGSRVKDRESRNEEFWNIHEYSLHKYHFVHYYVLKFQYSVSVLWLIQKKSDYADIASNQSMSL